jgi:hypothetical protein
VTIQAGTRIFYSCSCSKVVKQRVQPRLGAFNEEHNEKEMKVITTGVEKREKQF